MDVVDIVVMTPVIDALPVVASSPEDEVSTVVTSEPRPQAAKAPAKEKRTNGRSSTQRMPVRYHAATVAASVTPHLDATPRGGTIPRNG